ncbi:MAG: histidine triad nucleotide-binding protein [Massilia sp.]|nr:histidine triad nucleotide-binding protein [Massilia sp.]
MDNCLFCKIASKKIPASVVYEDEEMLAFKDINPAAPVHLLVIPKVHVATLSDTTAEHTAMLGRLLALAPKLAEEHGCAVVHGPDGPQGGYKTLINSGPNGGQEVYHLHLHVIGGPKPWSGQR